MPYLALSILTGTAVLVAVSYLRFRDVLYPGVLHASIWGFVLFLYCLSADSFLPLAPQTLFIFVGGMLVFAMGSYLASWSYRPSERPQAMVPFRRTRLLNALFWFNLLLLPVSFALAYGLAATGPSGSFLINLRLIETSGNSDRFIWNYLVMLSVVSSALHLLAIDTEMKQSGRLKFALSIPVAVGYCILNTGRTWFFMLLIVLMGLAVLTRKISVRKALLYSGTAALLLFVMIAVLLGKGGSVDKPVSDNAATLWDAFQTYLLGPLPSFDIFVRHHETVRLGDNTLRFFWAALDKIGFETPPVPLVHEFVNVPFPSNVYTVYRPYFDDFGLPGAVMVQFFLGLLHGRLYRKLARPDAFYCCLYAFSLYPLAMQFFQDQYLSLLSLWLQTVVVLLLITRLRRQQRPEPQAMPATSLA